MKNKRRIVTFEPEPDVDSMLRTARNSGLTLAEILNSAMRGYGEMVIRELAKARTKELKKLSGSFNCAELPEVGLAA